LRKAGYLRQLRQELVEESSKIVPLGAPLTYGSGPET
jgi:hypothetical protein